MSRPTSLRLRPIAALRAVRNLMRNREDTQQVFLLIEALRGKTTLRQFARFRQTETGRAVLGENRRLLDRLSDWASLAALPAGTLGRAYYDFMASESLSAEGLVAVSRIVRRRPTRSPCSASATARRTTCCTSSPITAATRSARLASSPSPTRRPSSRALP